MNLLDLCDDFVTAVIENAPFSEIKVCIQKIKNKYPCVLGPYCFSEYVLAISAAYLSENWSIINEFPKKDILKALEDISHYEEIKTKMISLLLRKTDSPLINILIKEYLTQTPRPLYSDNSFFLVAYYFMKFGRNEVLKKIIKKGLTDQNNILLYLALKNENYDAAKMLIDSGSYLEINDFINLMIDHSNLLEQSVIPLFGHKIIRNQNVRFDGCTDINDIINAIISNNAAQSEFFMYLLHNHTLEDIRKSKYTSGLKITDMNYKDFINTFCTGDIQYSEELFGHEVALHINNISKLSLYNMLNVYNTKIIDKIVLWFEDKNIINALSIHEMSFLISHFRISTNSKANSNNELLKQILKSEDPALIQLSIKLGMINSENFDSVIEYAVRNHKNKTLNTLYEQRGD